MATSHGQQAGTILLFCESQEPQYGAIMSLFLNSRVANTLKKKKSKHKSKEPKAQKKPMKRKPKKEKKKEHTTKSVPIASFFGGFRFQIC
jgi:hypothetical protein